MNQDQVADVFNKGIILGPTINKDRYICPVTGAHFEFRDMSRRIEIMAKQRQIEYGRDVASGTNKQLNKELKNQQAINNLIQKQKMEATMSYSNQKNGARQPTGSSKDKMGSHYQTEAGYAVTQEDEFLGHTKILQQPMPSGVKKTKEISQAVYQTKVGQMLKMKSHANARNGGVNELTQKKKNNNATYNQFPAGITQTQMYQNNPDRNLTEGDEIIQLGGSFDSRERVQEIKQRHLASQIPASKINFKKSGNNSKIGTIQKKDSFPSTAQPQYVYGDANFSSNSNEDSQERVNIGGKRMLTQPEKQSQRLENRENSCADSIQDDIQVIKNVGPISKTKQPSYVNASKRLSQQASARQFQQQSNAVGGFAGNRKLINTNARGPSDQMAYRQMEDSRNNGMYAGSGPNGNHYVSIGNQQNKVLTIGTTGQQRHLSHSGNNRVSMPKPQTVIFYGGAGAVGDQYNNQMPQMQSGPPGAMSKTGLGFHKRVASNSNTPGQKIYKNGPLPGTNSSKRALGPVQGGQTGHRRQYSTNVAGVQIQNTYAGQMKINGANLYEKRGRNAKGQIMFNHNNGLVGAAQSDLNVNVAMHQRNKTQVLGGAEQQANDSVFRSSIMSNEAMQKMQIGPNQNLRQSANPPGNMKRMANTSFNQNARVQSGDPRANATGSQGSQGQQGFLDGQFRRPSGQSPLVVGTKVVQMSSQNLNGGTLSNKDSHSPPPMKSQGLVNITQQKGFTQKIGVQNNKKQQQLSSNN